MSFCYWNKFKCDYRNCGFIMLVFEFSEFALDNQLLRAVAFFYATDNLCVDVERFADFDNLFSVFRREIYFKTVSHVEYLVHFVPMEVQGRGYP